MNMIKSNRVFAEVPPHVEYSLTQIGMDFKPVLHDIWVWGEKYQKVMERKS